MSGDQLVHGLRRVLTGTNETVVLFLTDVDARRRIRTPSTTRSTTSDKASLTVKRYVDGVFPTVQVARKSEYVTAGSRLDLMKVCDGCGAELSEGGERTIITVATETAERTGFTREVVFGYFHKNPPLVVCGNCARTFQEWDISQVKLIGRLAVKK